jgi:putative DNA primase/helicase
MVGHNNAPVTMDAARAALVLIPADDRDLWLRMGMALKSEFGDGGFELFETWSESSASFDAKAVKSVWKSFKAGAVTIATLIAEAKKYGFNPKQYAPAVPLSAADKARIRQERTERDEAAAAEKARKQAAASDEAVKKWAAAADSGASAYLERKGVGGYGVRYAGSVLLVPLLDAAGRLWSLQEIFSDGRKKFSAGGRVSGCFHVIGDVTASAWLLIAEGYATAATLHKATGYAVVAAFDEANIRHVSAAMRQLHPDAKLLICADDDSQTEAKTGKNPGIAAAGAAAKSVRGVWCKPDGLPVDKTDFNDLAAASGLDAVRKQIAGAVSKAINPSAALPEAALDTKVDASNDAKAQPESSATTLKQTGQGTDKGRRKQGSTATAKAAGGGSAQSSRPFFTVDDGGVWFHGFSQQGDPLPAQWICSPLHITAQSRDVTNGDWGYLLEFADADGNAKRWAMPASMLAGDGTQYRSTLLGMGLRIGAGVTAKNQLTVYIQTQKTDVRVRCTDRIGWHGDVYVLPDRTIGDGEEKVMFQAAGGVVSQFKQRGTLDQWRDEVAALCRGNSRMLFCVSAAFAAPLLHHSGVASGGFHIWGDSSSGKSTAFKVAGSVFGGKDYPRNWRMTDNALETVAAQHCDAPLLLDEIAQVDPKVAGDTVYMLANGQGKGRATQTATARKVATWRLLFLSDGEVSLANHMSEAGKGTRGGHDVRMAHITADAGNGYGVYDTLHDFASGAALSDHLVSMSQQSYGVAGMAFIEWAVANSGKLSNALRSRVSKLAHELCPPGAHGQVSRVAQRFALVGIAGELATGAGITGWPQGEAITATRVCFADWLASRGGAGNTEHTSILQQVSGFFQVHGASRFTWWHRATDDRSPNTINRAGFKKLLTSEGRSINSNGDHLKEFGDAIHPDEAAGCEQEYYVFPEVFRTEICKGFSPKAVAKLLIERGLLMPAGTGDKQRADRRERLPSIGHANCYRFTSKVVAAEA